MSADLAPSELEELPLLLEEDLPVVVVDEPPLPLAARAATELWAHVEAAAGLATSVARENPQAEDADDCCE